MEDIERVAFGIKTALENSRLSAALFHYKSPETSFISWVPYFRDVGAHFPIAPYYSIQPYALSCRFFFIPTQWPYILYIP